MRRVGCRHSYCWAGNDQLKRSSWFFILRTSGKALSERENEIQETGELSKSGDGGLKGKSGCRVDNSKLNSAFFTFLFQVRYRV
jgi:hypothetical protein